MNIAVVGTGYVGLVTGTCFAETGNNVTCIDIDQEKIQSLLNGKVPIYEPGLEPIYLRNLEQKRLKFTTSLEQGIKDASIIFLALPTPPGEDGSADLSYILNVANDLSSLISDYTVIVDKSTVPVGTSKKVSQALGKYLDKTLYDVVSNPEFLREGVAVGDFMKPERVVIGTRSEKARLLMKQLYEPFVRQGNPIIVMDEESAEMTKYAANAFLATKISFMNEIANLCDRVGANVDSIRAGIGTDSRIGKRFLFPGAGYGGSCFPKDVQALHRTAKANDYSFSILQSVMDVNHKQKFIIYEKIKAYFGNLSGKKIGLWGLAFKPNTDDIREAPALHTIDSLLKDGAKVKVFDPEAIQNVKKIYQDQIEYASDQYDCIEGADCLAILTEWNVFRAPDFDKITKRLSGKVIFDGRNVFDPETIEDLGYTYFSIGRPTQSVKCLS